MIDQCDRCGAKLPLETHFWVVKSGKMLCDTCNIEWVVLRSFWLDAVYCWRGDILIETKRKLISLEQQLQSLQGPLVG